MRTPPSDSASRPVTSALIWPRSRNSGRSRLNAVAMPPPNSTEDDERDDGQLPVQVDEDAERDGRGQNRAGQLHQAGADEIPDALGVGHDPRDQDAALGRVEVADRQAHHVRLDVLAHVGDRALRGDAENLRVGERADARRRSPRRRPPSPASAADPSAPWRRRRPSGTWSRPAARSPTRRLTSISSEAERQPLAVGPDQAARFFPRAGGERFLLRGLGGVGGWSRSGCSFGMSHAP